MLFKDTSRIALRGIRTNKLRSALTMLGIIIGVGSVVLMTSLGASIQGLILSQVSSIGPDSIFVAPGEPKPGQPLTLSTLTFDDAEAIEFLKTVEDVSPVISLTTTATAGSEEELPQIMGVNEKFFGVQNVELARGRLIQASDDAGAKPIALIAPDTARNLFGDSDPLGKQVKIKNQSFTIVGITKPLGSQGFQNADERIYIPVTTARILTGRKNPDYFLMRATVDVNLTVADITSLLRQRHRLDNDEGDPDKDDFVVRSAAQALDILGTVTLSLTIFLSAIAGISLVVGGIGIMNIMLVAVTERTREIGLRKAVGAKKRDVLLQFLIESVLLTCIGGLIGMSMGLSIAAGTAAIVRNFLSDYAFAFSLPSILLAFAVAAATGLIFGIYPAKRAAELKPIEALRYE